MVIVLLPLLCSYSMRTFRRCFSFFQEIRGSPKSHIVEHFSPHADSRNEKRNTKATSYWSQDICQSRSRNGKKHKNVNLGHNQSQSENLTPEQFAQMLRPAALATFLSSYSTSNEKQNPLPPEILSHQSIQFSPVLVEALFSNLNQNSPASPGPSGNPSGSSSKVPEIDNKSGATSNAGSVKERMVGITVVNEKSNHSKQKSARTSANHSSSEHSDIFPDHPLQPLTPSNFSFTGNGVYPNCYVSPTADPIIISSPPSRKNLYTKNHAHPGLFSTNILTRHPSGYPSHQHQVQRMRRVPSNLEDSSTVCASVHQSQTHLNEVDWNTPLSHHESLTVLSNIALTQEERLNFCSDVQPRFSTPQNSSSKQRFPEAGKMSYDFQEQNSQFCITSVWKALFLTFIFFGSV